MTAAASMMVAFYSNLLSSESKYAMEQDSQQADVKRPICEPTRHLSGRPKGNVLQVF
jgi:hypothetical protein